MSDRYKGAILSPTAPTVTPQSAGGIYTSSQQLQYQGQGVWPTAFNNPINNSLRFRSSASAYLNRTPASAGNRKTWTWSGWVKRGKLASTGQLFVANYPTVSWFVLGFGSDDTLQVAQTAGSSASWKTNAVFRDPSAWYHVVLAVDTTSATSTMNGSSTDRFRMYVNGTQYVMTSGTVPTQNSDLQVNNTVSHTINGYSSEYFDGYMAEVNFIDGQALTPSSFGTTDAYGVWQPIPYTGAYGTNGFYLKFTDNSALTTSSNVGLGKDFSGNGNYWVTNNISITSGVTYDSMTDVPTLTSATAANYAVLNPLAVTAANSTITNGNLQVVTPNVGGNAFATFEIPISGKWYFEVTPTSGSGNAYIGVSAYTVGSTYLWQNTNHVFYTGGGLKSVDGSSSSYGASYTDNDVIGVACDSDAGTITFYKNNVSQGSISHTMSAMIPALTDGASASGVTYQANFGQRPFAYTPPTGFNRLNTYNLPTPTILAGNQYFNAVLYSGNSSTQTITTGFQPDFMWSKCRNVGRSHRLIDSVRGLSYQLFSDSTAGGSTYDATSYASSITSTSSSGFAVTNAGSDQYNTSGENYVSWAWRASNAAGVSNAQGTITSTVSANTTAGFSIVTYTGTGSNATIGHGLGVAPSFIIAKARNSAQRWTVYTAALGNGYYGYLNETFAFDTANASLRWNTAPTSSVFGVGTSVDVNNNTTTYVAYCFAQVSGYSAFGSYTGNGSTDGPFIYTGFRPRFVIVKCSGTTGPWNMFDSSRGTYNVNQPDLWANSSIAETANNIDFLSNGFKVRDGGGDLNASSQGFIYMAFAENPFKIARAR